MFKKINKKFVFLYLILLILIIFLLRNINNSNLVENLSNNCGSCNSKNGNGKVGWFSFLSPLVNNEFVWSIEDAKNKFVNTLDGTTLPASSNPTDDQFRKR